ncbi:uncharacterized protein SCHCODRAFT_02746394 [Schizophyllum commune H4-8]|uniref:MYND-type domain-containing protein n=1 Tax=Schizophyllum commune (strain H4-8 / FGSC 9210) TaxID=578458 RepID=D8Q3L4_SCHCM|nr:uncharacterized protein SCHCODRAFT_02746394 [Schizophyllum commune H4-8]KAI5894951.1 hypothetical protein SCHCODRAFT_02746394 [Schizophyllum commune H4-8]
MAVSRPVEIMRILNSLDNILPSRKARAEERLTTLLTLKDTFQELQVDPFVLNEHQRQSKDPRVVGAMTAIRAITRVVAYTDGEPENQALFDATMHCTRRLWLSLVRWLDFIHPKQQFIPFNMQVAEVLACAYDSLYAVKRSSFDLIEQTPQVFSLLFDLWLHFPEYTNTTVHFDSQALVIFESIAEAIAKLTYYPDVATFQAHSPAIREAMLMTRMLPSHFYRCAVRNLQYCKDAEGVLEPDMCSSQFRALNYLAQSTMPIPLHSRETIHLLVQLLREANLGTDESTKLPGAYACLLLHKIWSTAEDDRSLVWALRMGVLPLMMKLSAGGQTTAGLSALSAYIFKRSVFLPVARVLGEIHPAITPEFTFSHVKICTDLSLDAQYLERLAIMKTLDPESKCGNDECPHAHPAGDTEQLKNCRCFRIKYCSPACQKVHWPAHRKICDRALPRFTLDEESSELSPIEIQYASRLAFNYLLRAGPVILPVIDKYAAKLADSSEKKLYIVTVDFLDQAVPVHSVNVRPSELAPDLSMASESAVQVVVELGPIRGGFATICMEKHVPVSKFRQLFGSK